ncbi:nuclear transcription factor Y, gamma [Pelomyxa schiedti]|nr:nuclear transcription factor Y, gamma [Pelomyxa schiedti]
MDDPPSTTTTPHSSMNNSSLSITDYSVNGNNPSSDTNANASNNTEVASDNPITQSVAPPAGGPLDAPLPPPPQPQPTFLASASSVPTTTATASIQPVLLGSSLPPGGGVGGGEDGGTNSGTTGTVTGTGTATSTGTAGTGRQKPLLGLPWSRVRKMMKQDGEMTQMVSVDAAVLMTRVTELFIQDLTLRSLNHMDSTHKKTLQKSDIVHAVSSSDKFDFLIDLVPKINTQSQT